MNPFVCSHPYVNSQVNPFINPYVNPHINPFINPHILNRYCEDYYYGIDNDYYGTYYNHDKYYDERYSDDEYIPIGYLHKVNSNINEPNAILPIYGKQIRENLFRYYAEYSSNKDKDKFKVLISKNTLNCETSREIYDDDIINVGFPIDAKYKFKEQKFLVEM